jgi:hypothetical protein
MPLKRLLVVGLLAALALRAWPIVGPLLWPGYRRSVRQLRRRADLATAAVMLGLCASMFVRGERGFGVLLAVLSLPAVVAAAKALREG